MNPTPEEYVALTNQAHTDMKQNLAEELVGKTKDEINVILDRVTGAAVRAVADQLTGKYRTT